MLTSWSMMRLIHTMTSSLRPPTVAPASSRCCSASDSSMTRFAVSAVRAAPASASASSWLATEARTSSASASTGTSVAATKAMNSLR